MDWGKCLYQGVATAQCIPVVFFNILQVLFMFAGTAAFIMLLISGLRFILANGDAKQLDGAKKTMLYAVIGLLLILFSYLILNIIATVTGVTCILQFGPFKIPGISSSLSSCTQ